MFRKLVISLVDYNESSRGPQDGSQRSFIDNAARRIVRRTDDGDVRLSCFDGVQYCLAVVFQIGVNKTVSTSPPNTVATCRYNIKVGSEITRFPAAMVTMSTACISSLEPLPAMIPSGFHSQTVPAVHATRRNEVGIARPIARRKPSQNFFFNSRGASQGFSF